MNIFIPKEDGGPHYGIRYTGVKPPWRSGTIEKGLSSLRPKQAMKFWLRLKRKQLYSNGVYLA
jgi:hypothetical protein